MHVLSQTTLLTLQPLITFASYNNRCYIRGYQNYSLKSTVTSIYYLRFKEECTPMYEGILFGLDLNELPWYEVRFMNGLEHRFICFVRLPFLIVYLYSNSLSFYSIWFYYPDKVNKNTTYLVIHKWWNVWIKFLNCWRCSFLALVHWS